MSSKWNTSSHSGERTGNLEEAANRIFEGYARLKPQPSIRLQPNDPVFAMGSCFAREIERALQVAGGNVVSTDSTVESPSFWDGRSYRDGFFHRFTPLAMLQEFQ